MHVTTISFNSNDWCKKLHYKNLQDVMNKEKVCNLDLVFLEKFSNEQKIDMVTDIKKDNNLKKNTFGKLGGKPRNFNSINIIQKPTTHFILQKK